MLLLMVLEQQEQQFQVQGQVLVLVSTQLLGQLLVQVLGLLLLALMQVSLVAQGMGQLQEKLPAPALLRLAQQLRCWHWEPRQARAEGQINLGLGPRL